MAKAAFETDTAAENNKTGNENPSVLKSMNGFFQRDCLHSANQNLPTRQREQKNTVRPCR